jgi:hypothetical protein
MKERGGLVVEHEEDANTAIVNEALVDMTKRLFRYAHSDNDNLRQLCVEGLSFVNICIRRKHFMNTLPLVERLRGRRAGGYVHSVPLTLRCIDINLRKVLFTEEDDDHLICHIAARIPKEFKGGRSGQRIYKELASLVRS